MNAFLTRPYCVKMRKGLDKMVDAEEKTNAAAAESTSVGKRLFYPDLLRIISSMSVIAIHAVADTWSALPPGSFNWHVLNVMESMSRYCIALFVMLSGMFFLDPAKPVSLKRLCKKNIPHMTVACFFWSFVCSAFDQTFLVGGEPSEVIRMTIHQGLRGHFTLWFLLMIVGLYLLTPFLRLITLHASRRLLEYFLLLFFVFGSAIPIFLDTLEGGLVKLIVAYLYLNLNLKFVLGYTGCYVAGYYFKAYGLSKRWKRILYISAFLSLLFTIGMTVFLSFRSGKSEQLYYDTLAPSALIIAAAVFVLAKEHTAWIEKRPKAVKAISYAASCTLGIYLIHDLINMVFKYFKFDILCFSPFVTVPLYIIFVFGCGLAIVSVLKKIPVVNKYIV